MMRAAMAQLVEHILGKDEVPSSNLGSSSKTKKHPIGCFFVLVLFLTAELALLATRGTQFAYPAKTRRARSDAASVGIFAIGEYLR